MLGNNSQTPSPTNKNENEETKLTTTLENVTPQSNVIDFSIIVSEPPSSEKTLSSSNSAFSSRKATPNQSGASSPTKDMNNAYEKNEARDVSELTNPINTSTTPLTLRCATNTTENISGTSNPTSTDEQKSHKEIFGLTNSASIFMQRVNSNETKDDENVVIETNSVIGSFPTEEESKPTMTSVAKATFFSCPTLPQAFTNPTLSHAGWALMLTGVALAAFGSLCAVSFVASMTLGIGLPLALIGLGLAVYDSCRAKNNVGSSGKGQYVEEYHNYGAGYIVPSFIGEY